MNRKKEKPMKITYHYIEPKTPEEKEEADRRLSAAYAILFEEVLKERNANS